MSTLERTNEEWVLEVNRNPTNSMNWLNIETLARVARRDAAFAERGVTSNWLLVGLYDSINAASAAAAAYRQEHAAQRPPEPDI